MSKYRSPERRSLSAQLGRMRRLYPEFESDWGRNKIRFRGSLKPSAIGAVYVVLILYSLEKAPVVRVLDPELPREVDGVPVPHRYPDGSLCLYYPKAREWTPDLFIADAIIPWTALWLFYYELWRATGTWHGGGVHPTPEAPR